MKKIIISISLLVSHAQGWAVDTFNPENGQLTIPTVVVGDSVYSNVSVNVKEVLNVKGGRPLTNFDSYNSTENILTIPSVSVSNNSYTNVSISVGNVLKVSDFKKTNQLPAKQEQEARSILMLAYCDTNVLIIFFNNNAPDCGFYP